MSEKEDKSEKRKGGRKLTWPIVIVICVGFVIIFNFIFNSRPPSVRRLASRIMCGTKMSAIGKAIVIYANDNNDMLPTPEEWCDLLIENVEATPKTFICPESDTRYGESSYAINANLSGKKLGEVPADTVMVFETDLGKESGMRKDTVLSRRFFKFLKLPEKEGRQKVYSDRWNQVGGPDDVTL